MAKLDLGKPEKFVFAHFFIRNFLFLFWFKIWYKNITIVGKKNLDRKTPTILAINHQNTAMDPLLIFQNHYFYIYVACPCRPLQKEIAGSHFPCLENFAHFPST